MPSPLRFCGLALCALLAFVPLTRASTVVPPTFDRLVGSADYVVRAEVKSVESAWRENPARPGQRYIGTRVELNVLEVVKGNPPSPLVLDLVGGRVGEDELVIEEAPKFNVGQESFLFIRGNGRMVVPLVGMMHGWFPVRHDARTGQSQVMRSNGRLLYSEQELVGAAAAVPAQRAPQDHPLSAADFSARIRSNVEKSTRENLK